MATAVIPYWPARLSEDMAAAYLSVSKTTFRGRCSARTYPQGVREGGRLFWSRVQLDRFVAAQFGVGDNDDGDSSWDDLRRG
jgi:hypothetical protein